VPLQRRLSSPTSPDSRKRKTGVAQYNAVMELIPSSGEDCVRLESAEQWSKGMERLAKYRLENRTKKIQKRREDFWGRGRFGARCTGEGGPLQSEFRESPNLRWPKKSGEETPGRPIEERSAPTQMEGRDKKSSGRPRGGTEVRDANRGAVRGV